ncbi:ABC transporter permease subunit [Paenibacillus sp. FSL R5-0887]|nr:ABC transporter permease subunit [Paenibacillus odorifer]
MRQKTSNRFMSALKKDGLLYMMALPGILALLAFSYLPMAGSILVFKEYRFDGGIFNSPWADPIFKNFQFFFNNFDTAMRATFNTIMFNILFFVFGTIFAVAIAIMLNEISSRRFVKVNQSIMFFPFFMSWMVIGSILNAILNNETGFLNQIIKSITGSTYDFYATPWIWIPILVIVVIWQSTGYNSIIYFGVLTGFDSSMYEAAEVDGASKLQQIFKITIPMLKPTIIILFLLSVGNMLRGNLNMIIGLTNMNPILLPFTDLIDVFVYRSGVRNGEMAFASAISLYQSVFGFFLVIIANKITSWYDKDSTLF